jgi:hypothetical protein
MERALGQVMGEVATFHADGASEIRILTAHLDAITVKPVVRVHGRSGHHLPACFAPRLALLAGEEMEIPIRFDDSLLAISTLRSIMLAVIDNRLEFDLLLALRVRAMVIFESAFGCRMRLHVFPLAFMCAAPARVRAPDQ